MTIAEAQALFDQAGGYLNTASYGLPPRTAWEALQGALADWREGRTSWEHWQEPCEPNDHLVMMENVIATPHVSYNTREAHARMVKAAAEDVVAVLNGRPPRFPVHAR